MVEETRVGKMRIIAARHRVNRGRSQQGAAAVEFALVAWPVIFIIGAIFEVGIFLLMQFELQFAVDTAARQVRINTASAAGWSATTFKQEVCKKIVMISNCPTTIRVNVQNATDFVTLKTRLPAPQNVGPAAAGASYADVFSPGTAGQAGAVIVTYDWNFLFPFLRLFSNVKGYSQVRRLYGMSVFRNET